MAATTIATISMLNTTNSHKPFNPPKPITTTKLPISLLSLKNLPKGGIGIPENSKLSTSLAGTAIAGAIFSTLSFSDPALAAQQIAEIAEGDNRGLALLLPLIPAIAWVLYNILQPALNQIDRMKSSNGVIVGLGLGLGGLAASGFVSPDNASATTENIAMIADAASSDNRGQLLLFVITPAIAWVLYNILQPALNQIDRMKS